MQEATGRRSNAARSRATRAALIGAARALFVTKGYAETSTPEVAAEAGVTRGALYHLFADKRDLFRAVIEEEAAAVAAEIEAAAPAGLPPFDALIAGSRAYLDAMTMPGRTRLLLIDAPAVLGTAETEAIDTAHAARTLEEGLSAALGDGSSSLPLAELTLLLSAAFDRAALAIAEGGDRKAHEAAIVALLGGVVGSVGTVNSPRRRPR